jgi:SulP family sulfate permease
MAMGCLNLTHGTGRVARPSATHKDDNPPMLPIASLARWLPFLAWPRPDARLLRGEFMAGITVGLMLVPQGVAYAALAGMPLITGIYASLVPALVAVLFSSSTRLGVGPTALTCLLIGSSLTGLAEPGSADWVALAAWMAILSGLLQLVMGMARFGWLLNLVTSPVLSGFTQAAALLILGSQLASLLGLRSNWGALVSTPSPGLFDLTAAAFGLGSLALLVLARRWRPGFPAAMVIVGAAGALSWAMGYADAGGAVVGALPSGLPAPYWPGSLPWDKFAALIMPVLVVTLVSFLETASSAKVESQRSGERWNENQDLIGQGLAKISSGLCGSFATSASFSRSAINLYAGAKSGWATVFSIALVLVVLLWLTPALYHVPQSVLAAVVVTAVTSLIKPRALLEIWRISQVEALIAGVTFALTLATAPRMYWGVLVGLLMNLSHFLYQRLHPRIIEVGLHPDGSLRDRHLWALPPLAPRLLALRMDDELDFASASALERRVIDHLAAHPETLHLCLMAQPINRIDVTGVETFSSLCARIQGGGGTVHISGLKLPAEQVLRHAGLLGRGSRVALYRTDADALQALQKLATPEDQGISASLPGQAAP